MRPISLRRWAQGVLLPLALIAFACPGSAAGSKPADKLHPSVRALLASPFANALHALRVVVVGDAGTSSPLVRFKRTAELQAVDAESVSLTAIDLFKLSKRESVRFVTADVPVEATAVPGLPGDPSRSPALYPAVVGAPRHGAEALTAPRVGIAVVDSGVAPLADFGTRLVRVSIAGQTSDGVGHGTLRQASPPERARRPLQGHRPRSDRLRPQRSRPGGVYTSDVVAALDWVFANGPRRTFASSTCP